MKKILTLFALLVLTVTGAQAQSEYSGIEISFNRSAATETNFTNFTVVVKDLDGNAISGVTAEPVSVAASDNINSAMGGAAAVSWTEKILVGGRYSNNNYNAAAEQNFVLKISGLRTGFAFNKAEVDLYGCNQNGAAVSSNSIAISCAIQTGNAADNLSAFVSSTGNNINGSQEGGLWHKVTTMKAAAEKTVAANEDLYVKVTIQKTNDSGTKCRPSFRTVKLSLIPMHAVTYQVVDANNTSTVLASLTKNEEEGSTITTFPNELYRNAFYTYTAVPETTVDAAKTITIQATLKDNAPVQYTTDATDPIYYNLNIRSKYLVYNSTATGEVTLQTTSEAFNAAASWAFVGTPYDGFRVINKEKGTGYNLIYTSVVTGGNQNNNNIQFQTTADAGDKVWLIDTNPSGFVLRMKENTNIYFHHDNGKNFLRTCSVTEWSNVHNDEGSTLLAATDETALIDLYGALAAVPFGDGLNQYGSTDADFAQKLAAVKDDIDNKNLGSYATDYATLQDLQASLSLNLPKANTFLRIKSVVNGYVSSMTGEEKDATLAGGGYATTFTTGGDATAANTIWLYDGSHLISYATGLYCTGRMADALGVAEPKTYAFSEATDATGKYWIKPSNTNYWYGGTPTLDYYSTTVGVNETRFELEEVTELPITLNAVNGTYYRTFSAPVDIATITGATMNDVTVAPDNKTAETVAMTASNGLKAGNGVVLIADSYSEGSVVATIGAADENATTNLKPQYASEPAAAHANHYFLGTKKNKNNETVVGFYLLKDTGKTGGFKAYIEKNASTAKEGFDLVFGGEVTGIDAIENAADNGAVFNLQGQRVNKAQKGIYIQNGKKVVLK